MGRAVELSERDLLKLYRSWGFEEGKPTGSGHTLMIHTETGRRVSLQRGKNGHVPHIALKKAADLVGVSIHEFKQGPPKVKKDAHADAVDLDEIDRQIRVVNGNGNGHAPEPTKEPWLQGGTTERIVAFLSRKAGICFKPQEVAERICVDRPLVSSTLGSLAAGDRWPIERVQRGVFRWWDEEAHQAEVRRQREAEEAERAARDAAEAEAKERASTFKKIDEDVHGRIMLKSADGEFYVAVKAEPGFFTFRGN